MSSNCRHLRRDGAQTQGRLRGHKRHEPIGSCPPSPLRGGPGWGSLCGPLNDPHPQSLPSRGREAQSRWMHQAPIFPPYPHGKFRAYPVPTSSQWLRDRDERAVGSRWEGRRSRAPWVCVPELPTLQGQGRAWVQKPRHMRRDLSRYSKSHEARLAACRSLSPTARRVRTAFPLARIEQIISRHLQTAHSINHVSYCARRSHTLSCSQRANTCTRTFSGRGVIPHRR